MVKSTQTPHEETEHFLAEFSEWTSGGLLAFSVALTLAFFSKEIHPVEEIAAMLAFITAWPLLILDLFLVFLGKTAKPGKIDFARLQQLGVRLKQGSLVLVLLGFTAACYSVSSVLAVGFFASFTTVWLILRRLNGLVFRDD